MLATIRAYPRKRSLGGGFRGEVRYTDGRPSFRTEVCATIEDARQEANNHLRREVEGMWVFGPPPNLGYYRGVFAAAANDNTPKRKTR